MIIIANATEKMLGPGGKPVLTPRIIVENLVQRYKEAHHAHLQLHAGPGYNTVYVSFSMADLISTLQKMQGQGSDQCRIYFGAHDSDAPMPGGYNYRNKMTLIFIGAKTGVDGKIVEQLDDDIKVAYDFGTLCPPQCESCYAGDASVSTRIFGGGPCAQPPA